MKVAFIAKSTILPKTIFKKCAFRRGFDTQRHCLVSIKEKWKEVWAKNRAFRVLVADLSKAFDCFHHELSIAKA